VLGANSFLRVLVVAVGVCWSLAFVVVALRYQLQLYGDGAMFSYSVAVQDAWAFHWHNISGRLTVFLVTLLPAEMFVGLTQSPAGGIFVYGLLFYVAPLAGLLATFALDRSTSRVIFVYACFSTACLCPLVFGFPTEMWLAHAVFWPALALAHSGRRGIGAAALLFMLLLMLILSHEAAVVLAAAVAATTLLAGLRSSIFRRTGGLLVLAMAIWIGVKWLLPPDAYFSGVLKSAALNFFDLGVLHGSLVRLLLATLAGYLLGLGFLARWSPDRAPVVAATITAVALAAYWLVADHSLHAEDRYYLRTVLVIVTPVLGVMAAVHAHWADGRLTFARANEARLRTLLPGRAAVNAIAGAFCLVLLVHAVETAKFVAAWTKYKAALAALATGTASDPWLGDPRFVSSDRIGGGLDRLAWFSTTPYLSVIVANFAPRRLVMDKRADNYFWLSCETATANFKADRAVPSGSRDLVRIHACLHR
jgi:hypothetical protein